MRLPKIFTKKSFNRMEINQKFKAHIDGLAKDNIKKVVFEKLSFREDYLFFDIKNGKVFCAPESGAGFNEDSSDVIVNKVKLLLKKSPKLFSFVYHVMNPSFAKIRAKDVTDMVPSGVVVNIGSGTTVVRPDVVNVDFYPFENVDFVSDAGDLPFADSTIDAVISECVLEHVPNPESVVSEIKRILKPGGLVYVVVPFVFTFHSSPYDFYRWSKMGIKEQFADFEEVSSGIHFGPGNAIGWTMSEYLATILSFGIGKLHQVLFMVFLGLFTPLGYLDFFINRLKTSENLASHVYFFGKKRK